MFPKSLRFIVVCAGLTLAACGGAASVPATPIASVVSASQATIVSTTQAAQATALPTATATMTSNPTATLALTSGVTTVPTSAATTMPTATTTGIPTSAPTAAATNPATSQPSAAPVTSGGMRFVLDPSTSQAKFIAHEQLASLKLPSEAVGTTNSVTGTLVMDANGKVVTEQSSFVVNLSTLKTDNNMRDNYFKQNTLQTNRYPNAVFIPTETKGLPSPIPGSGDGTFQLVGNMTIHGVTKPMAWDVTAHYNGQQLTGSATTSITFENFGMTAPRTMIALSVESTVKLQLDFKLARQS